MSLSWSKLQMYSLATIKRKRCSDVMEMLNRTTDWNKMKAESLGDFVEVMQSYCIYYVGELSRHLVSGISLKNIQLLYSIM